VSDTATAATTRVAAEISSSGASAVPSGHRQANAAIASSRAEHAAGDQDRLAEREDQEQREPLAERLRQAGLPCPRSRRSTVLSA
jgi:hypothetical protein